jgi:hypothetical protein
MHSANRSLEYRRWDSEMGMEQTEEGVKQAQEGSYSATAFAIIPASAEVADWGQHVHVNEEALLAMRHYRAIYVMERSENTRTTLLYTLHDLRPLYVPTTRLQTIMLREELQHQARLTP